jgi:hypothetical protein
VTFFLVGVWRNKWRKRVYASKYSQQYIADYYSSIELMENGVVAMGANECSLQKAIKCFNDQKDQLKKILIDIAAGTLAGSVIPGVGTATGFVAGFIKAWVGVVFHTISCRNCWDEVAQWLLCQQTGKLKITYKANCDGTVTATVVASDGLKVTFSNSGNTTPLAHITTSNPYSFTFKVNDGNPVITRATIECQEHSTSIKTTTITNTFVPNLLVVKFLFLVIMSFI